MAKSPKSTPDPTAAVEPDPSAIPLATLLGRLTTGQAWKLGATVIGVLLAAAAIGSRIENWQRDKAVTQAVAPKVQEIAGLSSKNVELANEVDVLKSSIAAQQDEVRALDARITNAQRFIIFADKYLTYLSTNEDPARSIFADHVCMLYRQSQQAEVDGVSMDTTSVARTLSNPSAPGAKELLITSGLSPTLVDELIELHARGIQRSLPSISKEVGYAVAPTPQVSPFPRISNPATPQRVIAEVTKSLSANLGQLVKVVTFHLNGRDYRYTMPPEIAGLVHNNPTCRLH
ncbi:hypothetical protein [Rhizobium leguminosarum]|uniref:hypothetical protein n=1 Tax=Rhizobium leguminosarum TaxID=384 RepID=UPI0014421CF6|nr:hypothetical protein [Rhizobium leguminosarum]MBY5868403.1 hypothetical protein [Rhizobium leguminosarum]NKM08550.1 hypothetical protein [Rhizobium leguminosarum bv. viciae]